ncbi:outer membrane lipid asymmetry maintenance protein MlaD [Gluconacetobacter entanii]|uniref:Outer membrane lipid asymmetry maintenance protein MlaD n=1 Tax=Gluconacetobacter entanii TaxID=108528 RepID=A0A318QEE2_9PROT|nr:outer membrane lipid asymmetry maintenance protein MlaD [Gluconacetobacter entanii]MBE7620394.1 MCE family protein [Komagataeibacter sp. FXV2]MCE2578990.1 outer membrane lipid asymmetry maintenance protein MlaD [Komagataeibacter sp. FNDCR1]MCW4589875.1 outer membrane lipid asymmetry maintenance protein MlaD [Gluconacetobacter entanii]MCW4593506.1 outer membrane lipid asymmetry maintenance protein MlaD [Gluconacetobacter entanii]NPC88518.1 outer membrane lipid asymmetry maintenance protein M
MVAGVSARPERKPADLLAGFAVLALLGGFLAYAVIDKGRPAESGYRLNATFAHIDGLAVGSDVRLAGITVGQVVDERVNPKTFAAGVTFTVRPDIKLPDDTAAIITSDSLLGGKYIALSPGGDDRMLKPGATIGETQGSISLEQLLSKFIFSVTDTLTQANQARAHAQQSGATDAPATPAPASAPAPAPLAPPDAPASGREP